MTQMMALCMNCGWAMSSIINGNCFCLTCDHDCGTVEENEAAE